MGEKGTEACEVRDDLREGVVPMLAWYGLDEAEEEKSMFDVRRGRVREGVTGEEGIECISCICLIFQGAVNNSRRYRIAQKK
jgi:hypothetical protein